MKKIILLLFAVALASTSCSSDSDDENTTSNVTLVKKVEFTIHGTDGEDDYSDSTQYLYNGTKLNKILYPDNMEDHYTYTGDLITRIDFYEDGQLIGVELFTYDSNDRLVKHETTEGDYSEVRTLVYNSNGTATSTVTTDYWTNTSIYHFENNEIVKIVTENNSEFVLTYDGKNSPYRNITGYNKIAFMLQYAEHIFGNGQNIVSIKDVANSTNIQENVIQYNSQNYPTVMNLTVEPGPNQYTQNIKFTY